METHTTEKIELEYVFVDDNGNEYKILENGIHGAADDWAFLFETEDENEDLDEDKRIETENKNYLDDKDYILDDDKLEELLEDNLDENIDLENEDIEITQENLDEIKDDCITPWNNVIKD
jgi:hypothetical protein